VRTPVLLFLLALLVRLVVGAGFPDPAYPDSAYYVDVARQLATGHGFNVDFVWIFPEVGGKLPANPVLPIPSNAHWMPLASIVMAPFIWLFGPTTFAANLPFALIGAASAPLAWAIARDAGLRREVAVGAGVIAAVPALSLAYMVQPENFALYGTLVAASLFLAGRGLKGHPWSFAIAGLLAGLASLARNEGLLVLGAMGLVFLGSRWRAWRAARAGRETGPRIPLAAALGAVALFALAVAPWYARQYATFGSFSPSTATGKVLFMRSFSEWNSITTPATLDHLLGMGWGPLLQTRIDGFTQSLVLFTVLIGAILLIPFLVIGAWKLRREAQLSTPFVYAALLLAFCTILVPIHVPGGELFHSAVGLGPHVYVASLEGAVVLAGWIAKPRRRGDQGDATGPGTSGDGVARGLIIGLVAFCVVAAMWSVRSVQATWISRAQTAQETNEALNEAGAASDDRVMSIDAAGTKYWSGRGGVVIVDDPIETVAQVAKAYGIRWLVLHAGDQVPLSDQVLIDGNRPSWVGPPAYRKGDLGVYPVCTESWDTRCQTTTPATPAQVPGSGAG
jgi:4-amino-4-deoxy-L-arabinose transferase-like glycosyltransferase